MCVVLVAALTGAWSSESVVRSSPSAFTSAGFQGGFSTRTVADVIAALGRAGIGVYRLGSSSPVLAPKAPVSPLRLSESEARNVALGAWAHSGLTGRDLDMLAPIAAADQTTTPPVSALVAAYVKVASTPGAEVARGVMGHQDWADVPHTVFPSLVLDLFVSDVVVKAGGAVGSGPVPSRPASLGPSPIDARLLSAVPSQASTGICSATQNFVNHALEAVFAVIPKINPPDPSSVSKTFGSFFGRIINVAITIGATFVNGLVQGLQFAVVNGVKVLIQPVLNAVAKVAGVVAVVAKVVTALEPWTLVVRANPTSTRKAAGNEAGLPGAFDLNVQTVGPTGDWPADIADCARVAGVELPPLRPQDAPVTWTLTPGAQDLVQATSPTQVALAKDSTAKLNYVTTVEPEENAKKGDPMAGVASGAASVHRTDLDQLRDALVNLVFDQIPAVIAPIVTPTLRAVLQPAINDALSGITRLLDPNPATTSVVVNFHGPPKPPNKGPKFADGTWRGTAIVPPSGPGLSGGTCTRTGIDTEPFSVTLKNGIVTQGSVLETGIAYRCTNAHTTGDYLTTGQLSLTGTARAVTLTGSVTSTNTVSLIGGNPFTVTISVSVAPGSVLIPTGGTCHHVVGTAPFSIPGSSAVTTTFDATRVSGSSC